MNAASFYKKYVGRLGSVLHLLDQILAQPQPGLAGDAQARLRHLFEEALTTFETVADRMHAQAQRGGLAIDAELCARLGECRAKLAVLAERCAFSQEDLGEGARLPSGTK